MALWTAKVFVNSDVGEITATVEASTPHGAQQQIEAIYGPTQQIVNLRQVNGGGGGNSDIADAASGCLGTIGGFIFLIAVACGLVNVAINGTPEEREQRRLQERGASVERVAEPYTPEPPAAAEPMFRDYPTPPPSYCVTENFEPC